MTEKEKMQQGLLYLPADPLLTRERLRAKELCYDFNHLRPGDRAGQADLLGRLLGQLGPGCCIEPAFWCDYGYGIQVGANFYANHGLVILDGGGVTFGDNVFIGPSCGFHTAGHPIDAPRRNAGLEYARPITVGSDVWFGAGVQVTPGVTIGSNVVIGTGSVVTRDVPSDCVAAGNPCRPLRPIPESSRKI